MSYLALYDADGFPLAFLQVVCYTESWQKLPSALSRESVVCGGEFHDLRHDFAHRACEAGWTLEELAYYMGHVTRKETPAIGTTVRYTQVSRAQVKEKLKLVKG